MSMIEEFIEQNQNSKDREFVSMNLRRKEALLKFKKINSNFIDELLAKAVLSHNFGELLAKKFVAFVRSRISPKRPYQDQVDETEHTLSYSGANQILDDVGLAVA